ncbi:patellin-4 [Cornus florida]|uniref:patellin-4 n=1 Tax=Cornus florida TaxID=4283 RepID=UPI002896A114|nr:patellin-4 [Cornus florida]
MTVEVKAQETQVAETFAEPINVADEAEKVDVVNGETEVKKVDDEPTSKTVEKSSSYREESNFLSDLKDNERKALNDFKTKLEEAILGNNLFNKEDKKETEKEEDKPEGEEEKEKDQAAAKEGGEGEKKEESKAEGEVKEDNEQKPEAGDEEKGVEIDKDISIWGIPLLPSKGVEGTDVVLLKFLRAREFKVNEAFEMLKKTLQWRKEFNIDSILNEDLGTDLASAAYMSGVDREGHPICYNIFGVLKNAEKTFGTEEKRNQFLRWRFQFMEKGIQKLDFKAGGVNSLLQINDLKNSPGPTKKVLRVATMQAIGALQDNYPEFVARNIFINVPFWFYAFHAILSPFLTQRTKSKFLVARPAKVTETLLKYIRIEEIPVQYGGFKRDNDFEFSNEDAEASELIVKAGSTETIELPMAEIGTTFLWDLTVWGWEVSYKEEFVPTDEGSYTIIVQKGKKMGIHEAPIRNTFTNNEPGKIVLTIENNSSKKKKVSYRYKTKKSSTF